MNSKTKSIALKILSLALSFMMVLSVVPVNGMVAFAAEEDDVISIQYLSKNIVQEGVEIKIKPNDATDDSYIGKTDKYGIWKTEVLWKDLSESFYISINGDSKKIVRSDEPKSFLIVIDDEKKWTDEAMPVAVVSIEADKTSVGRGESFEISSTVFGTPDKYQWYRDSQEIAGATSSVLKIDNAAVTDSGTYSCKVIDINGNSKTSDSIKITVSEKTPDGLALKAYAEGSEINGPVSRDSVKEIELKLENLPDDAAVTDVAYYVNGNCVSSGTPETSYVFGVEAGVEEYICKAEVTFDKYYEQTKIALSSSVQAPLLSQSDIVITVEGAEYDDATGAYVLTYSDSPKAKLEITVSGGSGDGEYTLNLTEEKNSDGSNASYNDRNLEIDKVYGQNKWKVEIKNAGSFKLEAGKEGDGNYEAIAPVSVSFKVNKASAGDFAFATPAPEAVVYNENNNEFTNAIVGEFSDVKYEIVNGDCAVIDEVTGKLSIKKAGTVTVKASLAESENYLEASAEYTLTVNKAAQTIKFEDKAETVYYGQSYSRVVAPVAVEGAADGYGYNHDEGVKPEYSIIVAEGAEAIAAVAEDGSLVFANQKTGTVTVKAVLAGNDCYEAAEAEYTLTVEKYTVENAYSISGEQLNAENGWYTGDITITPAEGHQISKTNNLGDTNEWSDSIVISTEGIANGLDVYLKNTETGAISEVSTIDSESVKIDTSLPTGLKVNYKTSVWYEDVFNSVTFGYYNSTVTFTIEAEDEVSGVEYFVWKLISYEEDESVEPAVIIPETKVNALKDGDVYVSEECVLGDENALEALCGKISFSVYDYAGHSEEYEDGYVIVIDTADPEVSIETDASSKNIVNNAYPYEDADENSASPIEVYSDSVNVKFRVIEKNFFAENAVASVNGENITDKLSWTAEGDNHYAVYELKDDGDYSVVFTYEDIFGEDINDSVIKNKYELSKQISVDTKAPEVAVTLSDANYENEGTKYYNETVTAEIIVKEEKFNPADLKISEVEGFTGMSEENKTYLADPLSWTYDAENGSYTATVEFTAENADGDYAFAVDYTDLAGNAVEQAESGVFVIDTTAPQTDVDSAVEATITVNDAYPYEAVAKDTEGSVDIFNDSVEIIFTVTEKNFFADRAVVTVNGEAVSDLIWSSAGDVHTAKYTLEDSDDYDIKLSYTDIFDDAVFESSDFIAVDTVAPEVAVTLSDANYENEGTKYYNETVTAEIIVKEEKFNPADLKISEVEGFTGMSEENKTYLADPSSWTYDAENGSYTASVVFAHENADDNYAFAVDYTDLAGNAAEQAESGVFVIDTTAPQTDVDSAVEATITVNDAYPYEAVAKDTEGSVDIFNDSVEIIFTVTEKNFFADRAVVTVNGEAVSDLTWSTAGDVHTAKYTLEDSDDYDIKLSYTDIFDDAVFESSDFIAVDKVNPVVTVTLSKENTENEGVKYYNGDVTAVITVKEIRFRPSEFSVSEVEGFAGMSDENKAYLSQPSSWIYDAENGNYTATVKFAAENADGDYAFAVDYTDLAGNTAEQAESSKFVIDTIAPGIDVDYGEAKILDKQFVVQESLEGRDFNNTIIFDDKDIVVTVKIDELNFDPEKAVASISIDGAEAKEQKFDGEWTTEGTVHTNTITISKEDSYTLTISCTDRADNISGKYNSPQIELSKELPSVSIEIATENDVNNTYFNKDKVEVIIRIFDDYFDEGRVKITAADKMATDINGKAIALNDTDIIPDFSKDATWTEGKNADGKTFNSATLTFSTQARYSFNAQYENAVGTSSSTNCSLVIDRTEPTHTVTYSATETGEFLSAVTFGLYNPKVYVKVIVSDTISGVDKFDVKYPADLAPGNAYNSDAFDTSETFYADGTLGDQETLEGVWEVNKENASVQAKAQITVIATDNCRNSTKEELRTDTQITGIDNIGPIITSDIAVTDVNNNPIEIVPGEEYDVPIVSLGITIIVKEANFVASKMKIQATAEDISQNGVTVPKLLNDYFKEETNWTHSDDNFTHTIELKIFNEINGEKFVLDDGLYTITVTGEDAADNSEVSAYTTLPFIIDSSAPINPEFTYSTPKLAKLISAVTFNYYNAPVMVTLYAEDSTSGISRFDWTYTKEKNASTTNVSSQSGYYETFVNHKFRIGDDGVAVITNDDEVRRDRTVEFKLPDSAGKQYRGNISFNVTDNAGNTSDTYTDSKNVLVVDTIAPAGPEVVFSEARNTVGSFEEGGKRYYDDAATATITLTEANFYPEDVELKINDEPYENVTWTQSGDVWTGNVTISGDGHYILSMNYSDRSTNKMNEYVSGEIIIDTLPPKIDVKYSPEKGIYNSGNREYFDADRTATITITEHNFDPLKVAATLVAENISGNAVNVDDIAAKLASASSWSSNGDVHTATVTYSDSANYTFSISCTDLSNRVSAEYTPDEFTVDKTPPKDLDVKFSESIWDTVIETISFGFYNAPVKVTVSADDDISGIGAFTYTYTDSSSGSPVTVTETIDVAANGTSHASKDFYVPAEAAQFKGNIKVSATDNAGNKSSEYTEDKTIVVDTVAPIGKIELSTEVQSNNGILYYSGDVTATLKIDEDNFYGEDVTVYVDGNAVAPSSWTSDGNTRTASVVVSADGEHRVSMSYTDKSSNKMEDVETPTFIIDHTAPVIVVSGIENNSANNAEKIGFTIRAEDTNFVASGFEAVLTAVVNNENNKLVTERIDLSGGYSTGNGYTVEVDNLEKDGVYTLTCKAVDLCGNTTTTIVAGNAQLSALRFSVNRNGSTFSLNEATEKLVDSYYVKSVDSNVVITETNVDPITQYKLIMNGTELVEDKDYTAVSGGGNGEWYINTYTIATTMFAQDGEYDIVVNSVDNANTESYSDIKGTKVAFVVDSSAPTITVSGMQGNGRYQSESQTVTLIPADDGGSLKSVRVEITDADGNVLIPFNYSGEELEKYLAENNGQITFVINEGVRQNVRVFCEDKAGNTFDSEQTYNDITVSSSKAVLIWESYGLYFILGGAGVVAAGIIIIILLAKKKKKKEEK